MYLSDKCTLINMQGYNTQTLIKTKCLHLNGNEESMHILGSNKNVVAKQFFVIFPLKQTQAAVLVTVDSL